MLPLSRSSPDSLQLVCCGCRMVVGCTLAVLGFTMYSYASIEARRRKNLTVYTSASDIGGAKVSAASDELSSPLLFRPKGSAAV